MKITGKITDAQTNETLPFANVFFTDLSGIYQAGTPGTITDIHGNYTLTGSGTHVAASYTGYDTQIKPAAPTLNFALPPASYNLPEVTVTAKMIWPRVLAAIIIIAVIFYIYKSLKK